MDYRSISSIALVCALLASITMAVISRIGVHPDEKNHIDCTIYFEQNWFSSAVGSVEKEATYSIYGFSYLDEFNLIYLPGGKLKKVLGLIFNPSRKLARTINVLLFTILVLILLKWGSHSVVVLLISPQLWYIFSYTNNDALPLFACLMITVLTIRKEQELIAFLSSKTVSWKNLLVISLFPLLVGLILLSKRNFYSYLLFINLYIFVSALQTKAPIYKLAIKYIIVLSMVAIIISPAVINNLELNGFHRNQNRGAHAEAVAGEKFKPSKYNTNESYAGITLKGRGVPLQDLILHRYWIEKSFVSFVGSYGYLNVNAKTWYYACQGILYLILIFSFFIFLKRSGNLYDLTSILFMIFGCLAICLSLWNSWVNDFQAQGRYLFPIIPMLMLLMHKNQGYLKSKLGLLVVTSIVFLSFYSFVFVGLLGIPK